MFRKDDEAFGRFRPPTPSALQSSYRPSRFFRATKLPFKFLQISPKSMVNAILFERPNGTTDFRWRQQLGSFLRGECEN